MEDHTGLLVGGKVGGPEGVGGPVGSGVLDTASKACSTASAWVLAGNPNNDKVSVIASSCVVVVDGVASVVVASVVVASVVVASVVVVDVDSLSVGSIASGLGLTASLVLLLTTVDEAEETIGEVSTSATVVETVTGTTVTGTTSVMSADSLPTTELLLTAPLVEVVVLLVSTTSTALLLLLLPLLLPLLLGLATVEVEAVNSLTNSSSNPFTSVGITAGVTGTGVKSGMVVVGVVSVLLSLAVAVVEEVLVVSDADDAVDDAVVVDDDRRGLVFAQLGNDDVITAASIAALSLLVMTEEAEAEAGRGMVSVGVIGPAIISLGLSRTEPGPSKGRSNGKKTGGGVGRGWRWMRKVER